MGIGEKLSGLRRRFQQFGEERRIKEQKRREEQYRRRLLDIKRLREEEKWLDTELRYRRLRERVGKKKQKTSRLGRVVEGLGKMGEAFEAEPFVVEPLEMPAFPLGGPEPRKKPGKKRRTTKKKPRKRRKRRRTSRGEWLDFPPV